MVSVIKVGGLNESNKCKEKGGKYMGNGGESRLIKE